MLHVDTMLFLSMFAMHAIACTQLYQNGSSAQILNKDINILANCSSTSLGSHPKARKSNGSR